MFSPLMSCHLQQAEGEYPGYFNLPFKDMLTDNFI